MRTSDVSAVEVSGPWEGAHSYRQRRVRVTACLPPHGPWWALPSAWWRPPPRAGAAPAADRTPRPAGERNGCCKTTNARYSWIGAGVTECKTETRHIHREKLFDYIEVMLTFDTSAVKSLLQQKSNSAAFNEFYVPYSTANSRNFLTHITRGAWGRVVKRPNSSSGTNVRFV